MATADSIEALPLSFQNAPRHPNIRRAVLLHQAAGLWQVAEGSVDLFALDMDARLEEAPLRPLLRLEAGEAFGALSSLWSEGRHPLVLAIPTPDARLTALPLDAAGPYMDLWVSRLIAAAPFALPPRGAQILQPMTEARLPPDVAVCAGSPLLWLATPMPLVAAHGERVGPGLVPLTPDFWVAAPEACPVQVLDTPHLPDAATRRACLDAALDLALVRIGAMLRERAVEAGALLERRAVAADRRLAAAGQLMAGLVDRQRGGADPDAETDPLVRACLQVAAHEGIALPAGTAAVEARAGGSPGERITAIARARHLRVRRARLPHRWWRGDHGAFVAFTAKGEPRALIPTRFGYRTIDASGHEAPVDAAAAGLEPIVFTFYRPFPDGALTRRSVLAFATTGNLGGFAVILAAGLCAALLGLLTPLVSAHIFDTIIPRAETDALRQVIIVLAAAACASMGFGLAQALAQLRLRGRVDAVVQSAVWDRLLRLPVPFFRRFEVGDLMSRAAGINTLSSQLASSTLSALFSGLFSVVSLGMMIYYQPLLALVGLFCVLLVVACGVLFAWLQLRTQRTQYELRGQLASRVFQLITGVQTLRVNRAERFAFWDWSRLFVRDVRFQMRASTLSYSQSLLTTGLMIVFQITAFAMFAFYTNGVSTGTFIAFNAAFGQFFGGMSAFAGALVALFALAPLYERTEPILSAEPEADRSRVDPGELSGRIQLHGVSFAYEDGGRTVLNDIDLDIRPGTFLAIVGASGSGKSTLLRLLLGFAAPTRGTVVYDNHDLSHLDPSAVRRQLGVVLQTGMLLPGSILDNIVANGSYALEEVWQAVRDAGLEADLKAMPMGLHTPVSEGGATFSTGQKQRLLIARALIRKPRIILFDEATSALDNVTQAQVSAALDRLRTTRIVIAHRLSTIVHADRIIVLDAGRIVESGTYAELVAADGAFAALAGRQIM
ncbi:NHLP bacteriocin export ABC transporter permease/ATPase subunit [Xanthobacteraceae bacterium A53D]